MKQEGAIVLGTGGDNSQADIGSFFEGVMTAGFPSAAADAAVQASIVAAGYAGSTASAARRPRPAGPAVVHDGYSSVYTVDSANGHLQETYLPAMGDPWSTQDLSAQLRHPGGDGGHAPVALVHCGYTSVYTVDASSGDLQETYLPAIGDPWHTQDLSAEFGTPPTDVTPTAVLPRPVYTSVYTVDRSTVTCRRRTCRCMGDAWTTQDLSANYGTPAGPGRDVPGRHLPLGVHQRLHRRRRHDHLQETYLPAMGGPVVHPGPVREVRHPGHHRDADRGRARRVHQRLHGRPSTATTCRRPTCPRSATRGRPRTCPRTTGRRRWRRARRPWRCSTPATPASYTVDAASDHLQETYLPAIGDPWTTQDLSANYGTPPTAETPIVLLHPDASGDLDLDQRVHDRRPTATCRRRTCPRIGDAWTTQDLSANYGTPPV